jgi:putative membrane protein
MSTAAQIFAVLAAVLHVFFFYLESIVWTAPKTWKRFGLGSQEEAELVRPMALNQGFYNLFIAIGVVVGVVLSAGDTHEAAGRAVVIFGLAIMLGASLVLVISNPKLARAAVIQGLFPAIGLLLIAL